MPNIIDNLGTRLFQSVTNKAGDIGEKFEEEFSRLSYNITTEVDLVVNEIMSLSVFIKVTLVLLCILIVVLTIRYLSYGTRVAFFKARDWLRENSEKAPPQVILLMPQNGEGGQQYIDEAHSRTPSPPLSPDTKSYASSVPFRPHKIGGARRTISRQSTMYADPITAQTIENIKRESLSLFHNHAKVEEV